MKQHNVNKHNGRNDQICYWRMLMERLFTVVGHLNPYNLYIVREKKYTENYELFCFHLQSSDIIMKLVRISNSYYADWHTLTCKGINVLKLHSVGHCCNTRIASPLRFCQKRKIVNFKLNIQCMQIICTFYILCLSRGSLNKWFQKKL